MRELQIGIAFVEGMTVPVVFERHYLRAVVYARATRSRPALVNVITEVHNQIELFFRHMFISRVVSLFVVLARGEGESQLINPIVERRRGSSSANRADSRADAKAVPVPACGLQPVHFDVH